MMCEGPVLVSTCEVTQLGLPCACQVVPLLCELHWSIFTHAAVNGGRGFAVQLLIEDGFEQRLEGRSGAVEAESEGAHAIDERGEFGVVRAQMRDGLVGVEGKFWAATVVNHGWSVSQADRMTAQVVHSPWFVRS